MKQREANLIAFEQPRELLGMVHRQKSTFAGNVLRMSSAPVCTQILAVILTPIITRFYTPDAYGLYSLVGSIVSPISAFVTMGYNGAIILPEKDGEGSNILLICLGFSVIISVLTIPSIWLGSDLLLRLLKIPKLGIYAWLIPLNLLAGGLYLSFLSWNIRNRCFGRIATARILNVVVQKSILLGAAFSGFATATFLLLGDVTGALLMSYVLAGRIWRENGELFEQTITWSDIIKGVKRYRKFPMFYTFTDLFTRLSDSSKIFLLSFYFSKSAVGYYGLGIAVLAMPMVLIGSSIGEVFSEKAARALREGAIAQLIEKLFKLVTWIYLLPLCVLAIIGDNLFASVFGANWAQAGVYAQILAFKMLLNFVMSPILNLSNIIEKQELRLILYIVSSITGVVSLIIGGLLKNVYVALSLLSILDGLTFFGFGLLMFYYLKIPLAKLFRDSITCVLVALPILAIIALVKWYFRASAFLLIITGFISCLVYYGALMIDDRSLREIMMGILKKVGPMITRAEAKE